MTKPDFPCKTCIGCDWPDPGWVPGSGSGASGVLVVAEAAGEQESIEGEPLVGKAGHYLWSNLARVGIEREGFRTANVLACRPPNNELRGASYEREVIAHCSPLLDAEIEQMQANCAKIGKTFVILTLGKIAFKRILNVPDKDDIFKFDYQIYPIWSAQYKAWVIAADHPSYLMRGQHHLMPMVQFAFKRALDIARDGFTAEKHDYLLDPPVEGVTGWVADFKRFYAQHPNTLLSYDIETPYKRDKGEDEVDEELGDDTILRISFSYTPNHAISMPWTAANLPLIEELFASPVAKVGWNSDLYDYPRIVANGIKVNGDQFDAMLCWHVLNSALDKRLGYVTPFYVPSTQMWKHMSETKELQAFYNAKDADMALRCALGIIEDLKRQNLWDVYEKHVLKVNRALSYMTNKGVLLDAEMRTKAEHRLANELKATNDTIQSVVPLAAKPFKVFKKTPADTTGMVEVPGERSTKRCPVCQRLGVDAAHFKSIGKKRMKAGEPEQPCFGYKPIKVNIPANLWARPEQFKLSKVSLQRYQSVQGHNAIMDWKKGTETFDEKAIVRLVKRYKDDPLYPLILDYRKVSKLLSVYIGTTELKEVEVPDDYQLKPGEQWKDA